MTVVTGEAAGDWTVKTLLIHLTTVVEATERNLVTLIEGNDRRMAQALEAATIAIGKADAATEKRFEGVNEFRGQLGDQARTFIPRAEVELMMSSMIQRADAKADALEKKIDALGTALEARLLTLEKNAAARGSVRQGSREMWAYVAAGISLAIAVAMLVLRILNP